jgi:hypothetical protein
MWLTIAYNYILYVGGQQKLIFGNFNCNLSSFASKQHNCAPFTAKGNIMTAEWAARAPTAHVVIRSCRKFENRCDKPSWREVPKSESYERLNTGGLPQRSLRAVSMRQQLRQYCYAHSLNKVLQAISRLSAVVSWYSNHVRIHTLADME